MARRWFPAAVFALTAVCFLGALRAEFVWDDWQYLAGTVGFRGFDARRIWWMLTTSHMGNWSPLGWLSYAADYALWGLSPAGFHLTSLLVHALNALLLYKLAEPLLRAIFPAEKERAVALGAAFTALAFALHPLRVESAAWASERRDVLSGLFFLSSLLLYVKSAEGRRYGAPRKGPFAGSIGCFLLAALSKATVVPLPAVLFLLDLYPLRRKGASAASAAEKAPYVLIAAAAAAAAVRAQTVTGNFTTLAAHGWSGRAAQAVHGLGFYLAKTVAPFGLSALYPLSERPSIAASVLVLCAAVLVLRRARVPGPAAAALWGYYAVMLLPVLGILQNGPQLVALRYSYLPCLGWALLGGCALTAARKNWAKAALLLWLAAMPVLTQAQLSVWHDDVSLWEGVRARFPRSTEALVNLSSAHLRRREFTAAEASARAALDEAPGDRLALLYLGNALMGQSRLKEAREPLEQIIRAGDWAHARELLGTIALSAGDLDEALAQFRRAAELAPDSAEAQANAGAMLARRGKARESLPYFERAAKLDEANPVYRAQIAQARKDAAR
jgi:tetratricopeptide (TPR) repeat protein